MGSARTTLEKGLVLQHFRRLIKEQQKFTAGQFRNTVAFSRVYNIRKGVLITSKEFLCC